MAYERFNPDNTDKSFKDVCFKCYGNITDIAHEFNVSRETIYQYLNREPKAKEILDNVRHHNDCVFLDYAEKVMLSNMMNYKNNPGLAQRSAEKVIDKKGFMRGWGDSINSAPPGDAQLHTFFQDAHKKENLVNGNEPKAAAELPASDAGETPV